MLLHSKLVDQYRKDYSYVTQVLVWLTVRALICIHEIERGATQQQQANLLISTAVFCTVVTAHSLTLAFQREHTCLLTPESAFQSQEVVSLLDLMSQMTM